MFWTKLKKKISLDQKPQPFKTPRYPAETRVHLKKHGNYVPETECIHFKVMVHFSDGNSVIRTITRASWTDVAHAIDNYFRHICFIDANNTFYPKQAIL